MLPTLGYLFLSNYRPQFAFSSHYSAPLVALVIGTSILGLARVSRSWQRPAAAVILINVLTAFFLVHHAAYFSNAHVELVARYIIIFATLLVTGPGRFGVDERLHG